MQINGHTLIFHYWFLYLSIEFRGFLSCTKWGKGMMKEATNQYNDLPQFVIERVSKSKIFEKT